jgi:hypothetical protein
VVLFFLLLDLRATPEALSLSKRLISLAIRAIPPDQTFFLATLESEFISFVTVFDTGPKIVSWPITTSIIDDIALPELACSSANADILVEIITEAVPVGDARDITQISLQTLLESADDFGVAHFVLFSSHAFQSHKHIIITWVAPVPIVGRCPLDGFVLAPDLADDLDLQVQVLIQRLTTVAFALDLRIETIVPRYVQISPVSVAKHSAADGFSQRLIVALQRTLRPFLSIPIEISATFTTVNLSGKTVAQRVVFSRVFPATREIIPILRSVSPIIALQSVPDFYALVARLLKFYERLLPMLPGNLSFDPFFLLLPNLQGFLGALLSPYPPKLEGFHTDEREVRFAPMATVWGDQDAQGNARYCCLLTRRALAPIVVVDSFDRIAIFADDFALIAGSALQADLERKVRRRFPVPRIRIFPRVKAEELLDENQAMGNRLRDLFIAEMESK